MRPRLLDLFCGAGGCSVGYERAGFDVVGVDIRPQPNYPFEFRQGDALRVLVENCPDASHDADYVGWVLGCLCTDVEGFDAVHASPPCQAFSSARVIHGREHVDLLTPMRALLEKTGLPWVIENVPGAPMRRDLILCGSMFRLGTATHGLQRHRWFEFSDAALAPALVSPCWHEKPRISVFGKGGDQYHDKHAWAEAMGIDWMSTREMAQAIPPAYTELIGHQLLQHIRQKAAA